jgi:hypothetical protein
MRKELLHLTGQRANLSTAGCALRIRVQSYCQQVVSAKEAERDQRQPFQFVQECTSNNAVNEPEALATVSRRSVAHASGSSIGAHGERIITIMMFQ